MTQFHPLLILIFILIVTSCQFKSQEEEKTIAEVDTVENVIPLKRIVKPKIHYTLVSRTEIVGENNQQNFSLDQLKIILSINRIDHANVWRVDSLIIPDTLYNDLLPYTPFPDSLPQLKGIHKLLLFSYPIQAFAAYGYGSLIRWGPVSMGKKSTSTPEGLFHTNWKSKETISTIDSGWVLKWYFNIDNLLGISMHEYDLPGYPASHSCIRMMVDDAYWLYYWADQWILKDYKTVSAYGTPVIIYGKYPFGKTKPWHQLAVNDEALNLKQKDAEEIINPHFSVILERQISRDSLLSQNPDQGLTP